MMSQAIRSLFASVGLCVGVAATGLGCGGGQTMGDPFDDDWVNDSGAAIGELQRALAAQPVARGANVAVGIIGKNRLTGVPLEGGKPWLVQHEMSSRPVLTGGVVVGIGGGELFALDATTGKQLWTRNASGQLRGAGDDGATTIVSLAGAAGAASTVLAIGRKGNVIRQLESDVAIGVPAVLGDYAFLPWKGQYVTVFDLTNGGEAARILLRSLTSHAFVANGALFFGETGVTRFDDKIAQAHQGGATTITLPTRELPGKPKWLRSGEEPRDLDRSARDNVRLYAEPLAKGGAQVSDQRFVATYYRIALGFDAGSGALSWAHAGDAEIVGGDAYDGGFAVCDAAGVVTLLDAKSGAVAKTVSLKQPIDTCLVQADGIKASAKAGGASLAQQLDNAVKMPGAEHAMVQKFILREMSTLNEPLVTKSLIDLASGAKTPPLLREEARRALAARRNGADYMIEALKKHYDYLDNVVQPPPVGPLAEALSAIKDNRAAPLLAAHLNDPANTEDDARQAALALGSIAGKEEIPALKQFFSHYRAAATTDALAEAVVAVAQGLVRLGEAELVKAAAQDPLTSDSVRGRLQPLAGDGK